MSHEILLLCGPDGPDGRERRRRLVQHAAERLPGARASELIDTPTAVAALVETDPAGGSFGRVDKNEDGSVQLAVAMTRGGLDLAAGEGHQAGSEAGHVAVRIHPERSVVAGTDGMASIPAFWAEHDSHLLFSTHLASLVSLGLPGSADERGVLEYLVMLHPLEDRTILQGARLLSSGGRLEWVPGSAIRSMTRPLFVPSPDALGDREAIMTFGEVWRTVIADVIERTSDERPALGLSGGLDSRAIAVTATEQGFRPLSYTYGTSRNREMQTATRVAQALDLPHIQIPVTNDRLLRGSHHIAYRLDGAHSPAEMYEMWFDDFLHGITNVVVNGLAGGPLWGDDKAVGLTDEHAVASRQWHRYAPSVNAIRPFLAAAVQDGAGHTIKESLDDSLKTWDFGSRADMAIFWKLSNRQLRWGNMLFNGFRRSGIRLETPFLDTRVLQFAALLSPKQRLNGRLYLEAHQQLFHTTDQIPRSDDGNSPSRLDHVYWSGESSLLHQVARLTARYPVSGIRRASRFAVHRGASQMRGRTGIRGPADYLDERADVFPADLWVRARQTYRQRLAALLESSPAHAPLSQNALAEAAEAVRRGELPAPALTLARLATANVWLSDFTSRQEGAKRA